MAKKNPKKQRGLHIASEAFALFVIAPTLWHMSKKPTLNKDERDFLKVVAVGTVLVDGYLLAKWVQK